MYFFVIYNTMESKNAAMRRFGALFTGGKDSTYSILLARMLGEVVCVINADSENKDSYMFHTIGSNLLSDQAEALGLPLERFHTHGEKEKELLDLEDFLAKVKDKYNLDGIVSGAIASSYQKSRVDKICSKLKLSSIAPLWGINQEEYLKTLVNSGFKIIIIKVSAEGLGKEWLGRVLDEKSIDELIVYRKKYGINVAGEGGEYESLVIDCPIFSKELKIVNSSTVWNDKERIGYLEIKQIVSLPKHGVSFNLH